MQVAGDRLRIQPFEVPFAIFALDAPVDVLADRTARRDTRPLLRNGDPKGTLERLAKDRGPSYAEAHIRITSGAGAHHDVVESIVSALESHLGGAAKP